MRMDDVEFRRLVDDARNRHNLSDILSRHTTLKRRGAREMVGLCPFHEERSPSFEVNDTKGTYHCHGCGAGGDAITALTTLEGMSFIDALKTLAGDAFPVISDEERAKRKADDERELADRIALARSIWDRAGPIAGTPAEKYLRSRAITIHPPLSVRFVRTPRWRNAETGEDGRDVPAMACALTDQSGDVVGVQCVFLEEDGRKYERQRPDGSRSYAKLSFGVVLGAALRLGPLRGEIIVCEGPEDGLSLMQQLPDRSIWVTCGTAGMSRLQFPSEVHSVVLAGDNGEAGRKAVEEAHAVYLKQGLSVREIFPDPEFKDWNDEIQGARS